MPSLSTFLNFCIETCNNPNTGYSMDFRYRQTITYSEALSWDRNYSGYAWNYHYDWENYTGTDEEHTYFDCSSYVSYALIEAGFSLNVFCTSNEEDVLSSLGWKQLKTGDNLEAGDIGWRSGHTEVCYQGGKAGSTAIFMGAHGRRGYTSQPAYNFYNQVSIGGVDGDSQSHDTFTHYWRYYDWDDSEPVPEVTNTPISSILLYAMCGNAWQESGINPARWEGGKECSWNKIWSNNSGGYGIFQFTNTSEANMELQDLWNYISGNGLEMYDGYAQCSYMHSGEGTSQHWWYSSDMYEASSVTCHTWDAWCNNWQGYSDDLWQMTYDFFRCWEGIHDGTENVRYNYAVQCQEYIPEHLEDESITEWIYGNRALSENEVLNNAVMFFRAMQTIHGSSGNYIQDNGKGGSSSNNINTSNAGTGDSGYSGTKQETISWEDFLLSGLGRNKGLNNPIHIIKDLNNRR